MDAFRIPQTIPQDLLLIHDIIGVAPTAPAVPNKFQNTQAADDCIDSSDSENGSEDEIEADLTTINDEDGLTKATPASDSSSESDSDSESEGSVSNKKALATHDLDDDEDSGPAPTSGSYFQTKNEIVESDIVIPDITEVGPEEVLEKVGEIMTVMGNTVVVNGMPSKIDTRGSDHALDSDTLLVFQDRKVMGYIYETFGPTSRPLYQVKYNKDFPLDLERVHVSRDVFHVPARSHFVFLSYLKRLKGSDASNVHDEEPADNELEFSDDEAEAAYKASIKRKRGESRGPSVAASSRQSTPTPSQMHDQDMEEGAHYSKNPYDEHGPYDVGFSAGPSRPLPIPYDDPYSDDYTPSVAPPPAPEPRQRERINRSPQYEPIGSRGRGRGQARDRGESGGRGRGRGRRRGDRDGSSHGHPRPDMQRRGSYNAGDSPDWTNQPTSTQTQESYQARPLSPTSFAIARATGQLSDGSNAQPNANFSQSPIPLGGWRYPDAFQSNPMFQFGGAGYPPAFVRPHINPRFANAFGMNMGMGMGMGMVAPSPQYTHTQAQHSIPVASPRDWTDEWAVPSGKGVPPDDTADNLN
ncbi:hypothetical protein DXG01_009912 [Tephrocybe rancida]|nr:hypothetical protein DXG01_009912 [Tephrocybe rancida]